MRIQSVYILLLAGLFTTSLRAQQGGGLQVFAGYRTSLTSLDAYLPGSMGGGPTIGADARLLGDDLYFLFGGSYSIQGGDGEFFGVDADEGYSMTSGRIGLGFRLFRISRKISIRSKAVASIHFVNDFETATNPDTGEDYLINDSFAGAITGLGLDIGALTLDLDYEYGLINAINKQSETTVDFITLTGGVKF